MFKVVDKTTNEIYEVYAVDAGQKLDSNPAFLVYESGKWVWHDANIYKPIEEITRNQYNRSLDVMADKIEKDRLKRKGEL